MKKVRYRPRRHLTLRERARRLNLSVSELKSGGEKAAPGECMQAHELENKQLVKRIAHVLKCPTCMTLVTVMHKKMAPK